MSQTYTQIARRAREMARLAKPPADRYHAGFQQGMAAAKAGEPAPDPRGVADPDISRANLALGHLDGHQWGEPPRGPIHDAAGQVRALRAILGLSQAKLAQALGVSPQAVQSWEQHRNPVLQSTLLALEALLGRVDTG